MKILYAREFQRAFKKMPTEIQSLYRKQERVFLTNWQDSRLHIKKLVDHPYPYSFRITRTYRVLFSFVEINTVLFGAIGHRKDIYD